MTRTTIETLTRLQIATLSREAMAAGDIDMVKICDAAAMGADAARRVVVNAINAAEAIDDEAMDDED